MKKLIITANDAGQRLDKYIFKITEDLPKSLLHRAIRKKDIKINGKRCEPITKLAVGDEVSIYLHSDFFKEASYEFLDAPTTLDILYEDDELMIINKPIGLLMHSGNEKSDDTLIYRVLHYLYEKKEYLPEEEQSFTPAFCNRIDRNTEGLVLFAKKFPTLQLLNEKIRNHEITRRYLCLARGIIEKDMILKGYHQKDEDQNLVNITTKITAGSSPVETHLHILEQRRADNTTLLDAELITGRSHQIRAHLASIGHPLVGDKKYGDTVSVYRKSRGQQLCAYYIGFDFTTPSGHLEYLKGKHFQLDTKNYFV